MEQNDTDNIININDDNKSSRGNRSNKKLAAVFCLLALACLGGLVYTTVRINDQKNKLEDEVKNSKEALVKANEVISKYESATGTKAVEEKVDNMTVKEIVKPMKIDAKIGGVEEIVKREYIKQTGVNDDGLQIKDSWPTVSFNALYTTNDAKYLVARIGIGHMFEVAKSNREGDTRVERGWGGATAIFYRAIPDGEWKKAYEGNGIPDCNSFSEEIKSVFRGQKDPEGKSILSCWDQSITENNGIVNL